MWRIEGQVLASRITGNLGSEPSNPHTPEVCAVDPE